MEDIKEALSTLVQSRGLMFCVLVFSVVLIAGSYQAGYEAGRTFADTATTKSTDTEMADKPMTSPEATREPSEPIELSGVGQTASEPIRLTSGLATVKMKHSGESNFSIFLLDADGGKVELLVNEVGLFDGSKAFRVPSDGDYVLDLSADGAWEVTIQQ